jgi:hypothetical protein
LLPALAKAKQRAQAIQCLNNTKQLALAWIMFADDNDGDLPGNLGGNEAHNDGNQNQANLSRTWALGWMDFDPSNSDNLNTDNLTKAQLGTYVGGSEKVFKCPGDKTQRVRSVSMNGYLGLVNMGIHTAGYQVYRNSASITKPAPADLWVFIDEREDSINDGYFVVRMEGFDPRNPRGYMIGNYPGNYHHGCSGIAFADGHSEIHKWQDKRTIPALTPGQPIPINISSPGNLDMEWLMYRSTSKIP